MTLLWMLLSNLITKLPEVGPFVMCAIRGTFINTGISIDLLLIPGSLDVAVVRVRNGSLILDVYSHIDSKNVVAVHTPGPFSAVSQAVAPPSRPATPSSAEAKTANGSLGTGASTPTSVKADGNIYFECLNCNRQASCIKFQFLKLFRY
jgi:hypothetical protein